MALLIAQSPFSRKRRDRMVGDAAAIGKPPSDVGPTIAIGA
jgi:hypothetical protein